MKRSTGRILTTHAGSLARPDDLRDMLMARDERKPYDQAAFAARVRRAVGEVVRQQVAAGIDVVNDGEQSKRNFTTYARERLGGVEERPCGINDGSTNAYLREDRAIEEFLKTIEPNYNAALAKLLGGTTDNDCVYTIAGFVAYVLTCSPAGMRIQPGPLKNVVETGTAMMDARGLLPPSPPELGGKSLTELQRTTLHLRNFLDRGNQEAPRLWLEAPRAGGLGGHLGPPMFSDHSVALESGQVVRAEL